ncbi:methyltransferase family protein [Kribbella sp. CWNU-51]
MTSYPTGAASRVYSAFAYLAFALTATWAIAFLADLPIVPAIDDAPAGPAWLAVPVDSALLFAVAASAYIAVGVRFEERDLHRHLGDVYGEYARRVPRFVPRHPRSAYAVPRSETKAGLS